MAKNIEKAQKEPLFHIVKRDDMTQLQAWLVRGCTILIAFLLVGIFSMIITNKSFGETYEIMFSGVFGKLLEGKTTMLWKYLQEIAILLSLALALLHHDADDPQGNGQSAPDRAGIFPSAGRLFPG